MPAYILLPLLIVSVLLPGLAVLASLSFARSDATRAVLAAVGFIITVGIHVGIAAYSYEVYAEWWSRRSFPIGIIYLPGFIFVVLGIGLGMAAAEKRDKQRR